MKYHNRKTVIDGIKFDSKKEANRYVELKLMEKAGVIHSLHLQPSFILQEAFTDYTGKKHRAIKYKADFEYIENDKLTVEDVKGFKTKEYRLKAKLFMFKYQDVVFKEII